jgi:hypothetical protein
MGPSRLQEKGKYGLGRERTATLKIKIVNYVFIDIKK